MTQETKQAQTLDQLITKIAQELQLPETVVRDVLRADTSYPVHTTVGTTTYKRATYIHVPMGGVEHTKGKLAGWRTHTLQPDEARGLKAVEVPGRRVDEAAARVWVAIEARRQGGHDVGLSPKPDTGRDTARPVQASEAAADSPKMQ